MVHQLRRIGEAVGQDRRRGILAGLHHAHDGQGLPLFDHGAHVGLVLGTVGPDPVGAVIGIEGAGAGQPEVDAEEILVAVAPRADLALRGFALREGPHQLVEPLRVLEAEGIERHVGDPPGGGQHHQAFAVVFRPSAGLDVVLVQIQVRVPGHGMEGVGAAEGGQEPAAALPRGKAQRLEAAVGVDLAHFAAAQGVDPGNEVVVVLDGADRRLDAALPAVKIGLQALQVVGGHPGEHPGDRAPFPHLPVRLFPVLPAVGGEHGGDVEHGVGDLEGIVLQGVFLDALDVAVGARGHGQDHGDADDADGARHRHQDGPGLLGPEVVEAQGQSGQEGHGRPSDPPVDRRLCGVSGLEGVAVGGDAPVLQGDGAGGVCRGQLRIVGHHHHEAVAGDLLQELHHLDAGLAVQGAGGLVGQEHVRVVDQGAGDGDALHLPAGQLRGLLVDVLGQADLFQGLPGPPGAFAPGDAPDGQRQLHVGQDRLVGDQVVALEHEADAVVAVGVPVPVPVLFCGDPVDDQVPAVIAVEAADDVEQCRFSRSAGAQHGNELAAAQREADVVERRLHQLAGMVCLADMIDLQHVPTSFRI